MGKYVTVGLADMHVGMSVTFWQDGGGIGGEITDLDEAGEIVISAGEGRSVRRFARDGVESGYYTVEAEVPFAPEECLEFRAAVCEGPVEMFSPGGHAKQLPRCKFHRDRRAAAFDVGMERYTDSASAPDWFDPEAAGETW